jgi:hypothetical protein
MEDAWLLAMRCPVLRQRESNPGFCTELENLVGSVKGKGNKRQDREAESTDGPMRGGLLRNTAEAA